MSAVLISVLVLFFFFSGAGLGTTALAAVNVEADIPTPEYGHTALKPGSPKVFPRFRQLKDKLPACGTRRFEGPDRYVYPVDSGLSFSSGVYSGQNLYKLQKVYRR